MTDRQHAVPGAAEPAPAAAPAPSADPPRGRRPSARFRREERREFRLLVSIALATGLSWLTALTPKRLRDPLIDAASRWWWRFAPTYRDNVRANVEQVLRATGRPADATVIDAAARAIFRLSAHNFADLLRLPRMGPADLVAGVRLTRGEWALLDDALTQGRGVVLLTAHLGAFEFVGHALTARGYPISSLTGRTTSRFVFDAVTHLRASRGMKLVEANPGGVRRVIHALRRGECVAFLADYDFFQNGLPLDFFGRRTTLPPGPIRIARDTGALVVGAFARRTAGGYALELREPFAVERTKDLDRDVERGMRRAAALLERAIAETPDQWVMFQRVWPSAPAVPVRVFPVGSPLESDLLRRVDAVLPEPRRPPDPDPAPPAAAVPADAPTGRTAPPPPPPRR